LRATGDGRQLRHNACGGVARARSMCSMYWSLCVVLTISSPCFFFWLVILVSEINPGVSLSEEVRTWFLAVGGVLACCWFPTALYCCCWYEGSGRQRLSGDDAYAKSAYPPLDNLNSPRTRPPK
jgi:hypothetical protein